MFGQHVVNGLCCIGHKLANDLVHCTRCKELLIYPFHYHVNSRDRDVILNKNGFKFLPYNVQDYHKMKQSNWDINKYPWEKQQ